MRASLTLHLLHIAKISQNLLNQYCFAIWEIKSLEIIAMCSERRDPPITQSFGIACARENWAENQSEIAPSIEETSD